MNNELELRIQQKQKLNISQKMVQSLNILQYSSHELAEYLKDVALSNPLIELKSDNMLSLSSEDPLLTESGEDLYIDSDEPYYKASRYAYEDLSDYEIYVSRPQTLHEYLREQAGYLPLHTSDAAALQYLIDNVDDSGYLRLDPQGDKCLAGCDVDYLIGLLQQMEPHGVGARSLEECLLNQLRMSGLYSDAYACLIEKHLRDLAAGSYRKISILMQIPQGCVAEMAATIAALHPRPGCGFISDNTCYIEPDIFVGFDTSGNLKIRLNGNNLPKWSINHSYGASLLSSEEIRTETARIYLSEKMKEASLLQEVIGHRQERIYQVTTEIVRIQREFFNNGPVALRPMTLRNIAAKLDIHESTISRICANKYMQTPFGLLPFKYFFSSKVSSDTEGSVSSKKMHSIIKALIAAENPVRPLSDSDIAEKVSLDGIQIARRTVAKYRDSMGIPNVAARRNGF